MLRTIRILALWLMAVAIPVQGFAAVVMPFCSPAHAAAVSNSQLQSQSQSAGKGSIRMSISTHSTAHGTAEMQHPSGHAHGSGSAAEPASDHSDGHAGHSMLKCCSAGFSMAAFFAPVIPARSSARSPTPLQLETQIYQGVILDGLDRPPRLPPA